MLTIPVPTNYTLPTASDLVLGGIKVGTRLSIANGILSADVQTTDISGKENVGVAAGLISTHAALLTGVHGLAITAGKVLTVQDNVTILGALGSAAYTADSNYLGASAQAVDSAKLGGSLPAAYALVGQTMNIGTTSVAINRASGALVLTGITSIDGTAANASALLTGTWAIPGAIGSTTPNTGLFTTLGVGSGMTIPLKTLDVAGGGRFTGKASSTLTGTADPTASTTLVGTGTLFTTELVIGDRITVNAETRTVTAIASDTSLTVDTAFTNTAPASITKLSAILITRLSSNAIGMVQNNLGYTGLGTPNPISMFHIDASTTPHVNLTSSTFNVNLTNLGVAGIRFAAVENTAALGGYAILNGLRARGTLAAPTPPLADDVIMALLSNAYDGTANGGGTAGVFFYAEQNIAAGVAPQRISFVTSETNNGARTEKAVIKAAGNFGINTPNPSGMFDVHGLGTTTGVCFQTADSGGNAKFTVLDNGTVTSVGNIGVNATEGAEMAPALEAANWTATNGWSAGTGQLVKVNNASAGTITPSGTFTVTIGRIYKVTINVSAFSGNSYRVVLGGSYGQWSTTTGASTVYIVAQDTTKLIISTGAVTDTATITSVSVKELTPSTGDLTTYGKLKVGGGIYSEDGLLGISLIKNSAGTYAHVGIGGRAVPNYGLYVVGNAFIGSTVYGTSFLTTGDFGNAAATASLIPTANTWEQRVSTSQQIFRIYNTYTNTSNYERLSLTGVQGASVNIAAESAGTGSANLGITLSPKGTGALNMGISTSLLGFYGVTAIARPTHIIDADGSLADVTSKLNSLLLKLETLGLLNGS